MTKPHPGTLLSLLDPQEFSYQTGVTLRGFSVTAKDDGWQVIFRGTKRTGNPVYCLYVAVDLSDAVQGLFQMITGKKGSRYWYPDKFAR